MVYLYEGKKNTPKKQKKDIQNVRKLRKRKDEKEKDVQSHDIFCSIILIWNHQAVNYLKKLFSKGKKFSF